MANTQVNITKNGTTTLATAGKYCDRNIDVIVSVAGTGSGGSTPTQFTNYYNPDNVVIDAYIGCSSANGIVETANTESNYIKIPYHHKANEPCVFRFRGISTVRSRLNFIAFKEDGATTAHYGQMSSVFTVAHDEYGDATLTVTSSLLTREWYYITFNFQYIGLSSATTALTGPIITINEPIGNGGSV